MYKLLHGQRLMSVHFHLSGNVADCNVKRCITYHNAVRKHSLTLFNTLYANRFAQIHLNAHFSAHKAINLRASHIDGCYCKWNSYTK